MHLFFFVLFLFLSVSFGCFYQSFDIFILYYKKIYMVKIGWLVCLKGAEIRSFLLSVPFHFQQSRILSNSLQCAMKMKQILYAVVYFMLLSKYVPIKNICLQFFLRENVTETIFCICGWQADHFL